MLSQKGIVSIVFTKTNNLMITITFLKTRQPQLILITNCFQNKDCGLIKQKK